ncbi:MAG: TetR/AcrR family transcriptional regulator [Rubrivivax sp.]|nr:MAG: TetR/AcrR family transcriptional regulator [Rubrivivax sp.]
MPGDYPADDGAPMTSPANPQHSKPGMTRQRMRMKSEGRRQLILEVAQQALRDRGYEDLKLADVSRRVGSSKATLHDYFLTKDELFGALLMDVTAQSMDDILADLTHDKPIDEVLIRFGMRYVRVRLSTDLIAIYRIAEYEGDRTDLGKLLFKHCISKTWSRVADFLDDAMKAGTLPAGDASEASLHLKALLESELRERRMLGVSRDIPSDRMLNATVISSALVWLKAYGMPPQKDHGKPVASPSSTFA